MLKLEKGLRDRQISIIVRDRERFFSRPIALAFVLALVYHLILALIFQVTPVKIRFNQTVLPPVHVDADGTKAAAALVNLNSPSKISTGLPERPITIPKIPEHPLFLVQRPIEYIKESSIHPNSFQRIEKEIYQPSYEPIQPHKLSPIHIVISGLLADKNLLSDGLRGKNLQDSCKSKTPIRSIYSVLIEERSGRIFWYEPIQQTNVTAIDRLAESILHDLQFSPDSKAFVTAGEIEFHFNSDMP